jgi:hypothetical protein
MGYVLGYGAHCFELYGVRTWIVAFWAFVAGQNTGAVPLGPVAVSVIFALLAMPASILGNEAALRFGRHRALTVLMGRLSSGRDGNRTLCRSLAAAVVGAHHDLWPRRAGGFWRADFRHGDERQSVLHGRHDGHALHVGFGLSAAGAWIVGVTLDFAGGPASASGWLFTVLAASILLGPVPALVVEALIRFDGLDPTQSALDSVC